MPEQIFPNHILTSPHVPMWVFTHYTDQIVFLLCKILVQLEDKCKEQPYSRNISSKGLIPYAKEVMLLFNNESLHNTTNLKQ